MKKAEQSNSDLLDGFSADGSHGNQVGSKQEMV